MTPLRIHALLCMFIAAPFELVKWSMTGLDAWAPLTLWTAGLIALAVDDIRKAQR